MKKQLLIIIFVLGASISQAQLHEIGIFVGGTNYVGDIGKTNYISPNKLAGGIIYKRNINTRIALRGTLSYLPIEADDADTSNSGRKARKFKFKNNIIELATGIEYNFFEYGTELSGKTFTPYILLELAGFYYKINKSSNGFGFAIPFGLGFKIKLMESITFAIETKVRYTFKDDLDSTFKEKSKDNITGNGNDWYMFTGFSFIYTFRDVFRKPTWY